MVLFTSFLVSSGFCTSYVFKTSAFGICSMLIPLLIDWIQSSVSGIDYQGVQLDMLVASITE